MSKSLAYLIPQYPALTETFIAEQVKFFSKQNFDLTIYSFRRPSKNYNLPSAEPKVKVVYLELSKNPLIISLTFLKVLFKKPQLLVNIFRYQKNIKLMVRHLFWCQPFINQKLDLVHCHFGTAATKFCLISQLLESQLKFMTTFYGYDVSHVVKQKGPEVYAEVIKQSQLNIVMSEDMKNRLIAIGFQPETIVVNPPGADFSDIVLKEKKVNSNEEIRILSVGRFVEKKGFDDLIRALAIVKQKTIRKFKCLIVGDGILKENIFQQVKDLKLDDIIDFSGFKPISEVYNLFYQAHLFIQPSKTAKDGDME